MTNTVKQSIIRNPSDNVWRLRKMLKNMFNMNCISEEITCSKKKNCSDHIIVIFYEFMCSNLNHCERTRTWKGQQTKTSQFEHCDYRVLLVYINTNVMLKFCYTIHATYSCCFCHTTITTDSCCYCYTICETYPCFFCFITYVIDLFRCCCTTAYATNWSCRCYWKNGKTHAD